MKSYIIQKDPEPNFEFIIMNVQDHLVSQFEMKYKNRVLAKGNNLQEVIIAFSQKGKPCDPIVLSMNET